MVEADNLTELLKKTEVNPETVLIALNGVLVTKNAIIKDGDEIKLLSVISGG
ncbi:MAG: MoaD/ThiS family protein [Nanoarchaeota archaeon]